ncbi:MAG TPA: hypothetical protein VHY83_13075 [Solirubrobacteraceae bacterium]|jgi:hypothetical protein|nr:hypothetical protein [Solirubrobacteraceae bacterium]
MTLWLFAVIVFVWEAAYLGFNGSYVPNHPVWAALWCALGIAVLVALVVWRQRWASWLFAVGSVWYVISPAWGAGFHPFWDAAELALLGLLVSPPTRRYVFLDGRPISWVRLRRDWATPLILSGLLTVLLAVPARHHAVENAGARVEVWIVFWLLLAALFRLIARYWPKKAVSRRATWAVSLLLGGSVTVLVGFSQHHHAAPSAGQRVIAWITVWLLFSALFRAIAWILQTAIRLARGREDPPATPGT